MAREAAQTGLGILRASGPPELVHFDGILVHGFRDADETIFLGGKIWKIWEIAQPAFGPSSRRPLNQYVKERRSMSIVNDSGQMSIAHLHAAPKSCHGAQYFPADPHWPVEIAEKMFVETDYICGERCGDLPPIGNCRDTTTLSLRRSRGIQRSNVK